MDRRGILQSGERRSAGLQHLQAVISGTHAVLGAQPEVPRTTLESMLVTYCQRLATLKKAIQIPTMVHSATVSDDTRPFPAALGDSRSQGFVQGVEGGDRSPQGTERMQIAAVSWVSCAPFSCHEDFVVVKVPTSLRTPTGRSNAPLQRRATLRREHPSSEQRENEG